MLGLKWWLSNLSHRARGWREERDAWTNRVGLQSVLYGQWRNLGQTWGPRRVLSRRMITTVGAAFVVDAFQNLVELETMNYHDCGTGTNAEAVGDTALQTPIGLARIAGTQSEVSSVILRSVATFTFTGSANITEHGIFSASSGGVLLDRSVFGAIAVINLSQIQFTYDLTVNTGT